MVVINKCGENEANVSIMLLKATGNGIEICVAMVRACGWGTIVPSLFSAEYCLA
jgi:hypothetical protein